MAKKIVWDWEEIDQWSTRTRVWGGWLVHVTIHDAKRVSTSCVFVADQHHEWMPVAPLVDPKVVQANLAKEFKEEKDQKL